MHSIVLNQSKIRIDASLKPKTGFPRPLDWWQRYVPIWVDASEDVLGNIVLKPNGKQANGRVREMTPVVRRREIRAIRKWMDDQVYLDFADAIVEA
ncbi:hypothetical protein SSOG_09140 [Streptomyces himastatinicus ATCC 53653]|uniref:Uncharacterized protein n=1 Tax=Streptomyces himastatinicus ATCC 53653 TaxID=457427 RepID=D9WWZ8_9ACTN|nr:hypothetical protein [Streptomyces himastatinicus]EFL29426.1 hypothetical protein SSOG_09140 [Streptomyces himastatinicus ATCC 53653]